MTGVQTCALPICFPVTIRTSGLDTTLKLYDPLNSPHYVSADQIEFILQKKVELFPEYFECNKQNDEALHIFFTEFVQVLKHRMESKIRDSDISLQYNMGVLDGKPAFFDIGNLTEAETKTDLFEESRLVLAWLHTYSPKWAFFLEKQLQEVLADDDE